MRLLITKGVLALLALLMLGLVARPGTSTVVQASPLLNITGTPAEPPPATDVPPPATAVPPANTAVPEATNAPQPTAKSTPEKKKQEHDDIPDIVIVETIDQSVAAPGDLLGFSLHVTNKGTKTAQNVVVRDELADYLSLHDSSTSKGSMNSPSHGITINNKTSMSSGGSITAKLGTVSPGEYVVVRFRAYLKETDATEGRNGSSAHGDNGDSDGSNNSSSVSFVIMQPTLVPTSAPTSPPEATAAPQVVPPTAVPMQPTKARVITPRPAKLPITGEGDTNTGGIGLLAILSVGVIALGIFLRRRTTL